MSKRRGRRRGGAADLQGDDRDAALRRLFERQGEPFGIARGFDEEADDPHLRPLDRIGDIVGDRRGRLSPGGDGEREAQARIVVRERAEDAAGMGDERDPARRGLARAREAAHPDPVEVVVEAHAVRPADGKRSLSRSASEAASERIIALARQDAGGEDHGGFRAARDGAAERLLQPLVPYRQDDEIGRGGQIGEPGHARVTLDLAMPRVHRVNQPGEPAAADHPHHVVAGRIRPH